MANFFTETIFPDPRYDSLDIIRDLALLEPVTRAAVLGIIADAGKQGIALIAFETYRSQDRQTQLFNQRVTQLKQVGVHHYGLACDLVVTVNGKSTWNVDYTFLGPLAKSHGLIWGGDWGVPGVKHSFVDSDHVQRCSIPKQAALFGGSWYPDDAYSPYR
jgi:hypothetical protein